MNWFCGMVDRRKVFSLFCSRDHCQRSSTSRISDTPRTGFEPAQNLSSGFAEWSCTVVMSTTTWCQGSQFIWSYWLKITSIKIILNKKPRSSWRLKCLRAEPPLRIKQPAMFTGHKSCDSGNNNFSICHVTSRWSLDKIVMWLKRWKPAIVSQHLV